MGLFYLGLSLLSNPHPRQGELHTEGRRVLSALEGGFLLEESLGFETGGRPYFRDGHGDFSISHSRRMAAVAYSRGISPKTGLPFKTGCDIQYRDPVKNREAIARRFFAPAEQTYIAQGVSPEEGITRFYRIWVVKECFLKALGLSVFAMSQVPSCIRGDQRLSRIEDSSLSAEVYGYTLGNSGSDQYLAAVMLEGGIQTPEIRWFSPGSLEVSPW